VHIGHRPSHKFYVGPPFSKVERRNLLKVGYYYVGRAGHPYPVSFSAECLSPIHKFDFDSVNKSYETQLTCTMLGLSTQFSAPCGHQMLGKAERLRRTLRGCASSMLHAMFVPNIMWSCEINTIVHLFNRTFTRALGPF
jgi:hypothetical protein